MHRNVDINLVLSACQPALQQRSHRLTLHNFPTHYPSYGSLYDPQIYHP